MTDEGGDSDATNCARKGFPGVRDSHDSVVRSVWFDSEFRILHSNPDGDLLVTGGLGKGEAYENGDFDGALGCFNGSG